MGFSYVLEPYLAQGSKPPPFGPLPFDVVVLAAMEYQEDNYVPPNNVHAIFVPLDDAQPSLHEKQMAIRTARQVTTLIQHRKSVLVTCNMGRNRSGLIVALTLINFGCSPDQAVARVRKARGSYALSNSHFVDVLHQYAHHREVRHAV
jgi:protein-tyrosine phosphatase